MELTHTKRKHIVDRIVHILNDGQVSHFYSTIDNVSILYSEHDEAYIVLQPDMTYSYAQPDELEYSVQDLSDEALIEWLKNEESLGTEDLEDYFLEVFLEEEI